MWSYNAKDDRHSSGNSEIQDFQMPIPHNFNHSPLLFFNFTHTLLSKKCCPQRNFFSSSQQLPVTLSRICHKPDETSPSLILLYTSQLFSSSVRFFSLVLYSNSHLSTFSSVLCHSLTFTPNRVLIFFYSFFFLLLFLKLLFSLVMSLV